MSAAKGYYQSKGIPGKIATEAQQELLATYPSLQSLVKTSGPARYVEHTEKTREASNAFLTGGHLQPLADLLRIDPSKIRTRYKGASAAIFDAPGPCEIQAARTDLAYTIIALGDLSFKDGLPALGERQDQYRLSSGDALHFLGDVKRTYNGKGGMLLLMQWSNLEGRF